MHRSQQSLSGWLQALYMFEKPITVKDIFAMNEKINVIGVTRGHGFNGKFLMVSIDILISVQLSLLKSDNRSPIYSVSEYSEIYKRTPNFR